jgi:putative ABC transport system substrate-binding protein
MSAFGSKSGHDKNALQRPLLTQSGHRRAPFCPLPACQFDPLRCVVMSLGGRQMRRRDFITLFGAAAAIWPLGTRAQQPTMPVVAFFRSTPAKPFTHIVAAFRQGLNETGFVEGQNVTIEQRWGDNQLDQLPALAADLVRRQPAVVVGNAPAVEAVRSAAATIPIVFVIGGDPVAEGLVTSLSRPGGNLTGVTFFGNRLSAKRVEMLHELIPGTSVIAILVDPTFPEAVAELREVEEAAGTIGQKIVPLNASNEREIDAAFASIAQAGAGALVVMGGPFFTSKIQMLVALSARYAIPAIYDLRDYVAVGGLISYGASFTDAYRQAGVYAGRILKGSKPSELPVLQPTTFELAINRKTARILGLNVPQSLIARADEVIE